ncbi:hypothetical protein BDV39DRAFT_205199 [Aspergillus sergii]|uniref:NAD(P)-binding protein n=1 Tax=Aspergillus sergii TaxID=1034303 RepID=A0A5N6X2I9_9EURO|nr:hypothetical protein BDV39DRAFT_205199 [Aspergillus sergii]
MEYCKRIWPQIFPSPAALAAATLPPQVGRVVIITGSTAGIGLALTRIYYDAGATSYIAARNESKAHAAIHAITTTSTSKPPETIKFLAIDLSDLRTVKAFVTAFLSQESRLGLLHNKPALLACHYILVRTAAASDTAPHSVQVIWSSSLLVDTSAPSEGVPPNELENPSNDAIRNYTISEVGKWFLADRFAEHFHARDRPASEKRVVSITANLGDCLHGYLW